MRSLNIAVALALASLSALSACRTRRAEPERTRAVPTSEQAEPNAEQRALGQRVAYRRYRELERVTAELARPEHLQSAACSDGELAPGRHTPLLDVADVRYEPKQLFSLDLIERIVGDDFRYSKRAVQFAAAPPPPTSQADAERALAELDALAARRYKLIYYVTDYAAPNLVVKIGRPKPEWVPGVIAAWLVLHDLQSGAALCQTQIIVRNDVKDEPIRRKLRSEVRQRLLRELGEALRDATRSALIRLNARLDLPSAAASGPVSLAR